jgi:hypothetical protein
VVLRLASCMMDLPALVVAEPEAAASELLPQDGILGEEVVNDPLQFAVGVPGDNASEQMPRLQGELEKRCAGRLRPSSKRLTQAI